MRKWTGLFVSVVFVLPVFFLIACSGGDSETASEQPPPAMEAATDQATPPEQAAIEIAEPQPLEMEGMPRTVKVDDLLFGGQPTPEGLEAIQAQGYKTVLNTRGDNELKWDEKEAVESLGMEYVSIPMNKPVAAITDEMVDQFARLMEQGERPMVAHCGSGNRVAGLWTVWLVERQGMDPEEALELGTKAGMTGIRPIVEKRLAGK